MPKMHIDKTVLVDKTPSEVFNLLSDFNNWTPWSPWIITEPETKVTVSSDKKSYSWVGDITGEGGMKITSEKENERIDIDLEFLKPWKSKAKVWFTMKTEGNGTRLHWCMDSSLPFFLFFMKGMMTSLIGMDYQRGLNMFKEFAEEGKVNSKLEFPGNGTFNGGKYVGIKTAASIDKMADSMKVDYTKLMEHVKQNHADKVAGNPFSIYSKWSFAKNEVEYTAAVPVSEDIPLLDGMFISEFPKTPVHTVKHTGPYLHVGNAWSAQYGRKQAKKIKTNKRISPIEEYLNSPMDTDPLELVTNIHFPIK